MAFTKITDEDKVGKGNTGLPDTPLLTTTEMQEQMDSLPNLAIDGVNRLIDELENVYGAQSIGMTVPPAVTAQPNVYSIINALALLVTSTLNAKHYHANKTVLDNITTQFLTDANSIVSMLSNIDEIQGYLVSDSTAIPTSAAVANFVENYNYKNIIKNAIYPLGSVYTTTTISPDQIFGTISDWTLIKTDSDGVKYYKRTS